MLPTDSATAWQHGATRHSWCRHVVSCVLGLVCWAAVWVVLLGCTVEIAEWLVWIFVPYSIYAFYRVSVQLRYFPAALRMRRVLKAYPWQILSGVPSGLGTHQDAQDDGIWFEFRNPADGEKPVPLTFVEHLRQYWWMRRMDGPRPNPKRRAQIEPLWFAGDPRFVAVIAAPAWKGRSPKRLHLLYQRFVYNPRHEPVFRGASPEDIERAQRVTRRTFGQAPQFELRK